MRKTMWDLLNKLAIISTLIGFPVALYSIYEIIYKGIVIYDMYKEPNEAGGDTLSIGNYTRFDYRNGKKQNPERVYHLKGYGIDDDCGWK